MACAENRVIGRAGRLPWHIPEDLQFFHRETAGQTCILGRICYETWPQVHAEGRRPIVITGRGVEELRPIARPAPPPRVARSLSDALAQAETLPGDPFICGGQRIYEETLQLVRPMRLHLTLVHANVNGDTWFPEWRHLTWRELDRRESHDAAYRYTFFTYERILP